MSLPPMPTRPGEPQDPELRERYLRDAQELRASKRVESARLAAEVPPSRTPSGPIWVVAGLLTLLLVGGAGFALAGPMLKQTSSSEQALPADITRLAIDNGVGDVRVRVAEAGESPQVTSTVEWSLREPTAEVTGSGSSARVRGSCPTSIFAVCSTDWTIVVPAGTDVTVTEGVGQVRLEGIDGDADVRSGVGEVLITDATSESIYAEVGVGSVRIVSLEPPREVEAEVGVGELRVLLPDTVDYDITADGDVGETRNSLGSTPDADRTVDLEVGVGDLSVDPS